MDIRKMLETPTGIMQANLITALRLGSIDWFQFFEGWKAACGQEFPKGTELKQKRIYVLTDGNTGKKVA